MIWISWSEILLKIRLKENISFSFKILAFLRYKFLYRYKEDGWLCVKAYQPFNAKFCLYIHIKYLWFVSNNWK